MKKINAILAGVISLLMINATVSANEPQNKYFYIKEDFKDGLSEKVTGSDSLTEGVSDNALEALTGESIRLLLPYTIYGGHFTMEFDLKRENNAAMDIGFYNDFHKDDWQGFADDFISDNGGGLNPEKRQAANKLIGISPDGTVKIQNNNARSIANWTSVSSGTTVTKAGNALKVPSGKWVNMKIELDTDTSSVVVYIDGKESDRIYGHDGMFSPLAIKRQREDGTYEFKHCFGIEDLVLYAGSGNICIDNVSVYKDSLMYENSDFNNSKSANVTASRFGWFEPTLPIAKNYDGNAGTGTGKEVVETYGRRWTNYSYLYNLDGVSYNENPYDTSLGFRTNQSLTTVEGWRYFDRPVGAGRAFTVEFDVRCDAGIWGVNLLHEEDMQITVENSQKTLTPDGIKTTIASLPQRYNSNAVITAQGTEGICFAKGNTPVESAAKEVTGIEFKYGEWHHIKLNVLPGINEAAEYKLEVMYEDGTTVTSELSNSERIYDKDIYGIGFVKVKSGNNAEYMAIDNLKVYSEDLLVPKMPEIVSLTVEDFEGNKILVKDSVPPLIKSVTVGFNTIIKGDSINGKVKLTDGENEIAVSGYNLTEGNTAVLAELDGVMLNPDTTYYIEVQPGVETEYGDDYSLQETLTASFKTSDYEATEIFDIKKHNSGDTFGCTFRVAKNKQEEKQYVIMVAEYRDYKKEVDGKEKIFSELVNIKYKALKLYEDDMGVFTFGAEDIMTASGEENNSVKITVCEYPAMNIIAQF